MATQRSPSIERKTIATNLFVELTSVDGTGESPLSLTFTDRQLDLMNLLWDDASATVREAKEALEEDLAYTSVLTVFQTLEEHGHVVHEQEGKAYRYYPTVSREEAGRDAVEYVQRRFFRDSPSALVATVLEHGDVSEADADSVRDLVREKDSVSA